LSFAPAAIAPVRSTRVSVAGNLAWFPLLLENGYFANPPRLRADEEGRVSYVEWPAAR
jgi:hypothetical protein